MGEWGVGMPAAVKLERFAEMVNAAFDECACYQVGSSLTTTTWRDVDVRVILDDERYAAMGFGDPEHPQSNEKWVALVLAFAALGREMTGLPIDFQIQQQTHANAKNTGGRNALGIRRRLRAPTTERSDA